MGDVVRFPQERCPGIFADDYRDEPAVILILPVVRIDRCEPEGPAPALRRRWRRVQQPDGILSPGTEKLVRAAFERLRRGDVSMADLPDYDPGPAIGVGPLSIGVWDVGPWPWPADPGDETD